MATPISTSAVVDEGGNIICCKYIKTGYNNPGSMSGTGASVLANAPGQSVNAGSTLTMTADSHLGVVVNLNALAGSAVTLPAATGTGNTYTILVTVAPTSNTHTITCAGSDKLYGFFWLGSTTAALTDASQVALNANTIIAMNGTTTGGIKGSVVYLTDMALNTWVVEANLVGSGTTAITGIT
jgi:hypothetical protein